MRLEFPFLSFINFYIFLLLTREARVGLVVPRGADEDGEACFEHRDLRAAVLGVDVVEAGECHLDLVCLLEREGVPEDGLVVGLVGW